MASFCHHICSGAALPISRARIGSDQAPPVFVQGHVQQDIAEGVRADGTHHRDHGGSSHSHDEATSHSAQDGVDVLAVDVARRRR